MKVRNKYTCITATSLALLLATGTVNAGPNGNNKRGASIGISNACALAMSDANKPVLRVTTTIIDKSSGDTAVFFTVDGTSVRGMEKGKGRDKYAQVGDTATFTGSLGVTETDIQLCNDDGTSKRSSASVSLNGSVSVSVDNDDKGEYANRCSDDPATDWVDESKVDVRGVDWVAACQ